MMLWTSHLKASLFTAMLYYQLLYPCRLETFKSDEYASLTWGNVTEIKISFSLINKWTKLDFHEKMSTNLKKKKKGKKKKKNKPNLQPKIVNFHLRIPGKWS